MCVGVCVCLCVCVCVCVCVCLCVCVWCVCACICACTRVCVRARSFTYNCVSSFSVNKSVRSFVRAIKLNRIYNATHSFIAWEAVGRCDQFNTSVVQLLWIDRCVSAGATPVQLVRFLWNLVRVNESQGERWAASRLVDPEVTTEDVLWCD